MGLILNSSQVHAGSCLWMWTANITDEDRFNSAGDKLSSFGQVLAQERYRFWLRLLPAQGQKIRSDDFWKPDGLVGNSTFHYKGNRKILTEIPKSVFNISKSDREKFWACAEVKVHIEKEGWDCDAEATTSVDMTVLDCLIN